MPELPEVETIRRDLARRLPGRRAVELWTSGKPLRLLRPLDVPALRAASVDRRVEAVRRRGKYLLVDFGAHSVVIHLGMSGQVLLAADEPRPPHTHVAWRLDDGGELRFVDPRRFGFMGVVRAGAEQTLPELAILGVDPLEPPLDGATLHALTRRVRRALKTFLLDQTRIAGVGNIYACEALFEAGLHPGLRADRLSRARADALAAAVVRVLRRGLANRGTSLRDYVDASGASGSNQQALRVYDREGARCPRCKTGRIRRVVTQARGTFYCPRCQIR